MDFIRHRAFARAALVGNPSDGYGGKTLSVTIANFEARSVLYEWDELEVLGSFPDQSRFRSIDELVEDVQKHGYFGGIPLIKAVIRRFVDCCKQQKRSLHNRNFTIRYESSIPRQVGLAGSSAIVIAALRCLMDFYGIKLPEHVQPSLALAAERDELGITAGLQDRVIQVYEGLVYMDFSKQATTRDPSGYECGKYERLSPDLLPPLYLAYFREETAEKMRSAEAIRPSHVKLASVRERFEKGDTEVIAAMKELADLTDQAKQAVLNRDHKKLAQLMNANFDVRRRIYSLPQLHIDMVEAARRVGASANFAGSGGAIIGAYTGAGMLEDLRKELGKLECNVIVPDVVAK